MRSDYSYKDFIFHALSHETGHKYQADIFTPYQRFLYKRLIIGARKKNIRKKNTINPSIPNGELRKTAGFEIIKNVVNRSFTIIYNINYISCKY